MGRKTQFTFILGFALLLFGSVGAWAYDEARQSRIAEGVTIGGVDVGGMSGDEAEGTLKRLLVRPLRKPVVVRYEGETWKLPARELSINSDIDDAVGLALEASGEGSILDRMVRYVTGDTVEKEFTPNISYSRPAVNEFVREIAGAINQDPVDASVEASVDSLEVVRAEPGREVRDNLLTDQITDAVLRPAARHPITAQVRTTAPEITSAEVARENPLFITVDRANFELMLWRNLEPVETYPIAVGQIGLETPAGLYHVQDMTVDPDWHVPDSDWAGDLAGQVIPGGTAENPLKARWLGIYDGAGIHGTDDVDSLGSAASHGCIRMAVEDVIELYDAVDVGTPIYIG